jgi:hypothetical protein
VLANWAQLQTALHPQGAKASDPLLGATASDVLLLSKAQLERSVLSDPGITIYPCGRHDIASGTVDSRVLAILAFLSRSGLKPTVSALRCGQSRYTATGATSAQYAGDAVDISAINGVPIGEHQGAGTITDLTIRTLMTLPAKFVPHEIVSLMRYPGAANTHANAQYWNQIHLVFKPAPAVTAAKKAVAPTVAAHSAGSGPTAPRAGRHDERARLHAVEPADDAGSWAADADRGQQAQLPGDSRPEAREASVTVSLPASVALLRQDLLQRRRAQP